MFPEVQDTILTVATPAGRSFHAVIRISGSEAIPSIHEIFVPSANIKLENVQTFISIKGCICLPAESLKIPAVLYVMRQPHSYTKEDIVEIHTLGGRPIGEMILQYILQKKTGLKDGLRLSRPGEFTRRAFLHGRIDLAQAEAIKNLIRSQSDSELDLAILQLSGNASQRIKNIQNKITSLCTYIETSIDFSDQDIELISRAEMINKMEDIRNDIVNLMNKPPADKISSEEIRTVLYGKPNVGKSSLINALLGEKRAIVSDRPGTTRDMVTGVLEMGSVYFKLTDVAGFDEAREHVFVQAREKAQSALKSAHLLLLVFAGNEKMDIQSLEINHSEVANNVIVVVNKCDLMPACSSFKLPEEVKKYPVVYVSALNGKGLERLKTLMLDKVLDGQIDRSNTLHFFNVYQKDALQRSYERIEQAIASFRDTMSDEFIAIDLRMAVDILGEVVGEITTEDILDKIFQEFCIGK
ncbi:tRNA uridine-5-carboxymethylaminomethyl(34) synthesis GTPase MnmE [Candidatus Kuenenia sp.]|uniref:tRNA uridine-5-carboxymethylaminomethyl(34) synthesis GTPase MnmE n=1 Tax=Candidatus Kuenenia sp. TaxID=2499824 RepID=UPI00321F99BC